MEYSALAAMDEEEGPMVGHHGEPGVDPALLSKLCRGEIPAIILRNALTPAACAAMVERLHSLDDEHVKLVGGDTKESAERFDVGTALGVLGGDREAFFADATKTHKLFATLFNRLPANPCDALYSALAALARPAHKKVVTAYEPDAESGTNRRYGPAIFRSHKPNRGYPPHFDSVRHREQRTNYPGVYQHETQLAGILLMQEPSEREASMGADWGAKAVHGGGGEYSDTVMFQAPALELMDTIKRSTHDMNADGT